MSTETASRMTVERAGQGKRLANLFLDYFFYLAFSFCVGFSLGIVLTVMGIPLDGILEHEILLNLVIWASFFLFFEGTFGWTPAKLVTGTVVVNEKDERPTFGQIVGRTLTRFVPFDAFSFLGADASGWHDKWSGTKVVLAKSLEAKKQAQASTQFVATPSAEAAVFAPVRQVFAEGEPTFDLLLDGGVQSGWINHDTLCEWLESGKVTGSTYVYTPKAPDWVLLRTVVDPVTGSLLHSVSASIQDSETPSSYEQDYSHANSVNPPAGTASQQLTSHIEKMRAKLMEMPVAELFAMCKTKALDDLQEREIKAELDRRGISPDVLAHAATGEYYG